MTSTQTLPKALACCFAFAVFVFAHANCTVAQEDNQKTDSQETDDQKIDLPALLIKNVTIIDVVSGQPSPERSILIQDGIIKAIGAATDLKIPGGALVVDASGKFAIPGLWDMHIHWYEQKSMALFPINGVTGVRFMWGSLYHHDWRRKFESGDQLGPRMYLAGPIIDGAKPIWPGSLVADSKESAKTAIATTVKMKSDFAKVYSLLSRDAYFAIAAECKKQSLPFAGHVPRMVTAREASDAGQKSMEHMYELIVACSSEEDELQQMLIDEAEKNQGSVRSTFSIMPEVKRRAMASFDQEKAKTLFKTFAENGTWQCPTLTVLRNMAYLTTPEIQDNPNIKYLSPFTRNSITPKNARSPQSDEQVAASRAELKFLRDLLPIMHEQGVPIIAGTDVLNPFCLPGFSLHDELVLLVKSGLEPIDALRAATINAAKFMDRSNELGSIEVGKVADLVLLDGSPLDDIANTKKIHAVIYQGVLRDRQELDELLAKIEEQNRPKPQKGDDDE